MIKFEVKFEFSIEKVGWDLDRSARDGGGVIYDFLILATIGAFSDADIDEDRWVFSVSIL